MGIPIAQSSISEVGLVALHQGDLTMEAVDAIVNAANSRLAHGGGVAGAIVRRGGKVIQEESSAWVAAHGPLPVGGAAWTGAGALKARGVIHAVGPIWGEGDEHEKLKRAATSAFQLAEEHACRVIALPAISSGIFGFPKPECASILVGEAAAHFQSHEARTLKEIRFTIIDDETVMVFKYEFVRRFGTGSLTAR